MCCSLFLFPCSQTGTCIHYMPQRMGVNLTKPLIIPSVYPSGDGGEPEGPFFVCAIPLPNGRLLVPPLSVPCCLILLPTG
mmetsp:Transcript_60033/g.107096  ORF Transcript_60033/g.107096 Transcript_60033/m.107096 type:complete len:80 (+) Transcript_60033:183-422(+)